MKYEKVNLNGNYNTIRSLFEEHWTPFSDEDWITFSSRLPNEGVFAIDDELGIVGMIFLYTTNSSMCINGFPTLSKKIKKGRKEIIDKMFDYVEFIAKYNGFLYMNTWSGTKSVIGHLRDRNYLAADVGVTHFIKPLF